MNALGVWGQFFSMAILGLVLWAAVSDLLFRRIPNAAVVSIVLVEAQALAVAKEAGDLQVSIRGLREPETKDAAGTSTVNEKTAAVTHLQDATGILGTQRPAAKTVITYQGAAVAPVTF